MPGVRMGGTRIQLLDTCARVNSVGEICKHRLGIVNGDAAWAFVDPSGVNVGMSCVRLVEVKALLFTHATVMARYNRVSQPSVDAGSKRDCSRDLSWELRFLTGVLEDRHTISMEPKGRAGIVKSLTIGLEYNRVDRP